jgi:hypothetical protein
MKNKVILLIIITVLSSCSVTIIISDKSACMHGDNNKADISGSHLKENTMSQSADGKATIPFSP